METETETHFLEIKMESTAMEAAFAAAASKFSDAKTKLPEGSNIQVNFGVQIKGVVTKGASSVGSKVNPEIDPARVLAYIMATNPDIVVYAINESSKGEYKEVYGKYGDEMVTEHIANIIGIPHRVPTERAGSVSGRGLTVEFIK